MISHQSQATQPVATYNSDRVAVLLAGYGEVQSIRDLSLYNQAATKYIASQFLPIPDWLYPLAGKLLALQDFYNFGVKHNHFKSPENEIFEKQRLGIEEQLQNLDCVNDDPDFLKIAAEWANPHIEAMLSVPQYHEHIKTRRLNFD